MVDGLDRRGPGRAPDAPRVPTRLRARSEDGHEQCRTLRARRSSRARSCAKRLSVGLVGDLARPLVPGARRSCGRRSPHPRAPPPRTRDRLPEWQYATISAPAGTPTSARTSSTIRHSRMRSSGRFTRARDVALPRIAVSARDAPSNSCGRADVEQVERCRRRGARAAPRASRPPSGARGTRAGLR